MEVLRPGVELRELFDLVAGARQRLLVLDYDGTLAPFHVERNQAYPYPGVGELLSGIIRSGGTRVVMISGRVIADLIPLLRDITPLPEIWGSHGAQRRLADGSCTVAPLPSGASQALEAAREWAFEEGFQDRCDCKPASIAFHWRGCEPAVAADLQDRVRGAWEPFCRGADLSLEDFDGGLELRVAGLDKGHAVLTLLSETGIDSTNVETAKRRNVETSKRQDIETPAAGATPKRCMAKEPEAPPIVAYLGDDRTDEDAFRVLRSIPSPSSKGLGWGTHICVLVRKEFRPTEADLWLQPPDELLSFLGDWQRAVETGGSGSGISLTTPAVSEGMGVRRHATEKDHE